MPTGNRSLAFRQVVSDATDEWIESGLDSPASLAQDVAIEHDYPIEDVIAEMYRQSHAREEGKHAEVQPTPFTDFYAFLAACERVGILPQWQQATEQVFLFPTSRLEALRAALLRDCPHAGVDPVRLAVDTHRERIRRQVQLERQASVAVRAGSYAWVTAEVDTGSPAITWALAPHEEETPEVLLQRRARPVFGEPATGKVA